MAKAKAARPTPKAQTQRVVQELERLYPDSHCALHHEGPFQLLVATILSAQCTDVRVNMVTPSLFTKYPNAASLAAAIPEELEGIIRSTGFFRAKAKNLRAMAETLSSHYGGEVPADIDALTKLPGVGRKTANVVLGNSFQAPAGVVVDTHVKRLSNRLGMTKQKDPVAIEKELNAMADRKEWVHLSHRLIDHGRKICLARKPRCEVCELASFCPRIGVALKPPSPQI